MIAELTLWAALGLIAYTYVGFPALLAIRARLFPRPVRRAEVAPSVSMIIVAHNEKEVMAEKLENVCALDYPAERLEVIVASDGSNDGTDDIVCGHGDPRVMLLPMPRGGKAQALNAAVERARGEILVFSDANSMFARDALRRLVTPFADPTVGAVGGNQVYRRDGAGEAAGMGERMYWAFDRTLKSMQSVAGNMTAATGAIHAIRRELVPRVPPGVSDDFMISTAAIAAGKRLFFAADAVAYESVAPTDAAEFARKQRVTTRALQSIRARKGLLDPRRHGFYSLQLASHKIMRWMVGWLMPLALISALALYGTSPLYTALAIAQCGFYGLALAALLLRGTPVARLPGFRILSIPFYVCLSYLAALRATVQVFRGGRVEFWESRAGVAPPASLQSEPNPHRTALGEVR